MTAARIIENKTLGVVTVRTDATIADVVKIRLDDLVTEVEALHGYITSG